MHVAVLGSKAWGELQVGVFGSLSPYSLEQNSDLECDLSRVVQPSGGLCLNSLPPPQPFILITLFLYT